MVNSHLLWPIKAIPSLCCSYRIWTYDLWYVTPLFLTTELRSSAGYLRCTLDLWTKNSNIMKTWKQVDTCGTWTPTSQCKCDVLANYTTWPICRVEKTRTSNSCIPNAGGWPITQLLYIAEDIGFEPIHPFRLLTV